MSAKNNPLDSLDLMTIEEKQDLFHRELETPQFDENGVDELGIKPEEVLVDMMSDKEGDTFTVKEFADAYKMARFEKSIEIAMQNLVDEGRAEYGTCSETGEQTFRVFSDEELEERQENT